MRSGMEGDPSAGQAGQRVQMERIVMENACPRCGRLKPQDALRCECGHDFSAPAAEASEAAAICPLCGSAAERGCVFGGHSWFRMRWLPGEPSFGARLKAAVGGGLPVGERRWL